MFKGLTKSFKKVFGTKYERDVKEYTPIVAKVNEWYSKLGSLSNDELRNKTHEFRSIIKDSLTDIDQEISEILEDATKTEDVLLKEDLFNAVDKLKEEKDKQLEVILKEILPEAFAVVKETARRFMENETLTVTATEHDKEISARNIKKGHKNYVSIEGEKAIWSNSWVAAGGDITWNMVHYDVQLIGGMVLHDGKIAEMATGEGKTLVATLPAYLNGVAGMGVHIITVNDYLARRDSEWVGPIMEFLFLNVDCIDKYKPHSEERKAAYQCDITYGTNSEFGFDYLRDNMVRSQNEMVQLKHHYTLVDEVDSVLVDDARTPLIISGPVGEGMDEMEYNDLNPKVARLVNEQKKLATKYLAEGKKLFAQGKTGYNEGEAGMALLRAYHALPKYRPLIKFLSEEGVKVSMQKAENFYMQEQSKNMHLVDDELFFVIDEKNRIVDLTEKGADIMAKGSDDPQFFVLPDFGDEIAKIVNDVLLTEKDKEEAKEKLGQEFSIKSKRLHAVHQLLKAYTLFEKDEEYVVIEDEVKIVDESTGRMMEGRRYSDGLHQALEAKENVKVGEHTQTYATVTLQNYFRMYHKLAGMTGTAETEAGELWEIYKLDVVVIPTNRPIVRDDKEDLVYKTSREKFNSVIDEIISLRNQGRPILVGTTSVDISEKLSRMLDMKDIPHNVLNAKQHQREAEVVAEAGLPGKITLATNMAGRGTDIKIGDAVKKAGGLAIIGTERHDSRRVDRQLRGRAGRQGDPGSSQFYVSLEDNLMRLFHSERIAKLMDKMGHSDGEVIQHSMVSKSIERAQKKVEENNFGIRKRLLEYDDVMNIQREAIYKKRTHALSGQRLAVDLHNMFDSLVEETVGSFKEAEDYEGFKMESLATLGIDVKMSPEEFKAIKTDELTKMTYEEVMEKYHTKGERIARLLLPLIKNVYENEGHKYKRIAIPFSDGGSRQIQIAAHLKDAIDTKGKSIMEDIEKALSLALIDENWKEHLRSMDELKESVQSASFEQKDPLVIYKMEAFNLFETLVSKINHDVVSFLLLGQLAIDLEPGQIREAREQKTDMSKMSTSREEEAMKRAAEGAGRERKKVETVKRTEKKVGRNEPCPCGSGKKFKQCHGRN